jgi:multiple sugar transport system substrate-binding protein
LIDESRPGRRLRLRSAGGGRNLARRRARFGIGLGPLIMRKQVIVLATALVLTPLDATAADLVVWWDQGYNPEEDAAVREVIAAFERESGKHAELVFHPQDEHPGELVAAIEAGRPPDFAFAWNITTYAPKWALEDRLVDLSDAVGHFSDLFDPYQLDRAMLLNARTNERGLYGLPFGYVTDHLHVWKSLLQQSGFVLDDIPKEWEPFWSFWCDQVQPAVRKALGRDDIWGVALSMSTGPDDTDDQFFQFVAAYDAHYVTPDGELVIDDPDVRQKLVKAIDSYTAIYRKSCSPPDAANWRYSNENNKAFVARSVVMTPNYSLSTINALKNDRPDDYYENTATIGWPLGASGEAFPIPGWVSDAVVFKDGGNVVTAKEFVRFLVAEGWLMHYLNLSGERMLPSIPALLDQPFWLDPSDPHHMAAVMQAQSRPVGHHYTAASGDLGHDQVYNEHVWAKAIHRVAAEGVTPGQAVDEAIARIKEILSE